MSNLCVLVWSQRSNEIITTSLCAAPVPSPKRAPAPAPIKAPVKAGRHLLGELQTTHVECPSTHKRFLPWKAFHGLLVKCPPRFCDPWKSFLQPNNEDSLHADMLLMLQPLCQAQSAHQPLPLRLDDGLDGESSAYLMTLREPTIPNAPLLIAVCIVPIWLAEITLQLIFDHRIYQVTIWAHL